jgi:hypothetical protein
MRPLTKEDALNIKKLSIEQLEEAEHNAYEWFHFIGETRVEKYISQEYPNKYLLDDNNRKSWGEVISNPKGVRIFVKEYPPRLKQFGKTKFSKKLGYGDVRETWRWLLRHAVEDIKKVGYTRNKSGTDILVYRFHYKKLADPDQFNIILINDVIKDYWLISDDNLEKIQVHMCGVIDPENPGTEIYIIPFEEFFKYPGLIKPKQWL